MSFIIRYIIFISNYYYCNYYNVLSSYWLLQLMLFCLNLHIYLLVLFWILRTSDNVLFSILFRIVINYLLFLILGKSNSARIRFVCTMCGKSYSLARNLQRHQKVECGKEKLQKCQLCGCSYYYKRDLKLHMFRVHKMYGHVLGVF